MECVVKSACDRGALRFVDEHAISCVNVAMMRILWSLIRYALVKLGGTWQQLWVSQSDMVRILTFKQRN